jgi:phospholipid/cholesterol/gamma-HCH transport system substrate-binding protein
LAARGSALNDTVASLPALFLHLRPVAGYLSDPATRLTGFFDGLDRFFATVAPVAQVNARLFGEMASTFEGISRDPRALEATISKSPATLDVSTGSLVVQQPFLVDFQTLGRYLAPASVELRRALPQIDPALEEGASVLGRTPSLNEHLQQVMDALKRLALAPGTNVALNALSDTTQTLNPMVRYLGPYQTVCDYWNYWWTFLSEHISEATRFGFAQRALLNFANHQPNNVGQQGATQPANGYAPFPDQPDAEYLHDPVYGSAVDNQGLADCETGQRGYPLKLNYLDPRGRNLETDQHTPGDQGSTYAGRPAVPAGETFSRNLLTGPLLPFNPTNP